MNTIRTDSEVASALAAYRTCLAQAVARSPGVLDKLLAAARDSLYQRSRQLQQYQGRGVYAEALQTLSDNAVFMVQRFPTELEDAVRHGDGSAVKARVQPLELSLVDDAQVQGHVELTRSQQAAHQALEAPLADFDALVSSAQGFSRIQPQRNPLRPETYLRALQALVERTQASPQVRSLWMQHLTAAMGLYLRAEYEQLSALLRDAGVVPVGYEAVAIARAAQKPPLVPSGTPPAEVAMPAPAAPDDGTADAMPARPWKAPSPDLAFSAADGQGAVPAGAPAADGETLVPGMQVELLQDGQWRAMQLLWSSPHGSLLLFEGPDGHNESMTRRLCMQCMKENRMRIVRTS